MRKWELPESWFEPLAVLNEHDDVQISTLDEDFDERYENNQGILIPVAAADGRILSEKRQKSILKHFLTGFSRTRFEYMIGVLRSDTGETVTQVRRWCELFKRITGEHSDMAALDRVGVRAFAIAAPRSAADTAEQRDAFTSVLNTGLPTAIYKVPALSKAEIDPALIRELLSKYDNLLIVFGEEELNAPHVSVAGAKLIETRAFELVGEPITTGFILVEDDAGATTIDNSSQTFADSTVQEFGEARLKEEYQAIAEEFALIPLSERGIVPYTAEASPGESLANAGERISATGTTDVLSVKASKGQKTKKPLDKIKILRRVLTAELVAGILMSVVLVDTVQVQASERRSDVLAAKSAEMFMSRGADVMDEAYEIVSSDAEDAIVQAKIDKIRDAALNLEYVEEERDYDIEESEIYKLVQGAYEWDGSVLTKNAGTVTGPNGRETYYNLNMSGVVSIMRRRGNTDTYWVRSDGCKMLGNYIMVAANLDVHPRGSIVRCSRGLAIVCDTGGFAVGNPQQLDVATAW